VEPKLVSARLAELGVTAEQLLDGVRAGELARASCTPHDPRLLPGVLAWGRTVRGLRERLCPLGWVRSEERSLATVGSPDGQITIGVSTGDEATGVESRSPRTKYPKGPATIAAVDQNQLWLAIVEPPATSDDTSDRVTWILLIHRAKNEVRSELSLPAAIGDDGRIDSWSERIILPVIALDQGGPDDGGADDEPNVDVEVSRRKR
jgi:hypothetical protein